MRMWKYARKIKGQVLILRINSNKNINFTREGADGECFNVLFHSEGKWRKQFKYSIYYFWIYTIILYYSSFLFIKVW